MAAKAVVAISFVLIGLLAVVNGVIPLAIGMVSNGFEGQAIILRNGTTVENASQATIEADYLARLNQVSGPFNLLVLVWLTGVVVATAAPHTQRKPPTMYDRENPQKTERLY